MAKKGKRAKTARNSKHTAPAPAPLAPAPRGGSLGRYLRGRVV
jgi:hypothetical protein